MLSDIFLNHLQILPSRSLRRFFNITREDGLGDWFSSTQTFLIALVLFIIFFLSTYEKTRDTKRSEIGWLILGCFFLLMSFDDGTKLHERLGTFFRESASDTGFIHKMLDIIPSYTWLITVGPVFVLFGIFIAWFLFEQIKQEKQIMIIISALSLLALAMGLDLYEGLDIPSMEAYKHYMKAIEETMEMFANTLFLVVFLDIMFTVKKEVHLIFKI